MSDILGRAAALPMTLDVRLIIDSGGSTLRLAVVDPAGTISQYHKIVMPQDMFDSLDEAIADYLVNHLHVRPVLGVAGMAATIIGDHLGTLFNNQAWPAFDSCIFEEVVGTKIRLYNDMYAAVASIPKLDVQDIEELQSGQTEHSTRVMISTLSTGVNSAMSFLEDGKRRYVVGESGHWSFIPYNEIETELLRWSWARGRIDLEFEDFISGSRGFAHVFSFVTEELGTPAFDETMLSLRNAELKSPAITHAATALRDPAAMHTLKLIGPMIGTYLAHAAMAYLPFDGSYLMGGVVSDNALMRYLADETEMFSRFAGIRYMRPHLSKVPVYRVLNPEPGLLGAAEIACALTSEETTSR